MEDLVKEKKRIGRVSREKEKCGSRGWNRMEQHKPASGGG